MAEVDAEEAGVRGTVRRFLALERDVLVLSVAMFAFSLGFRMTSRYVPRYMSVLGAGAVATGLFGTFGNLIAAVYPIRAAPSLRRRRSPRRRPSGWSGWRCFSSSARGSRRPSRARPPGTRRV